MIVNIEIRRCIEKNGSRACLKVRNILGACKSRGGKDLPLCIVSILMMHRTLNRFTGYGIDFVINFRKYILAILINHIIKKRS